MAIYRDSGSAVNKAQNPLNFFSRSRSRKWAQRPKIMNLLLDFDLNRPNFMFGVFSVRQGNDFGPYQT